LINRRQNLPQLLLALSLKDDKRKDNDKNSPIDMQKLTGHSISGFGEFPALVIVAVTLRRLEFRVRSKTPQKRTKTMAKEMHLEAAKHHTEAAHHHAAAAALHDAGHHEHAHQHSEHAHAASAKAHEQSEKAHEASVEHAK
jgi:hypothetical protein